MIKDKKISIRLCDSDYSTLSMIAKVRYKGNISKLVSGLISTYVGKVNYENK